MTDTQFSTQPTALWIGVVEDQRETPDAEAKPAVKVGRVIGWTHHSGAGMFRSSTLPIVAFDDETGRTLPPQQITGDAAMFLRDTKAQAEGAAKSFAQHGKVTRPTVKAYRVG